MSIGKDAAVLSSRGPLAPGKPMATPTPSPRTKTPTTPGLSDKMRQETSHALETMLKKSSFLTGLEHVVKQAARAALPMARVVPAGSGVRTPASPAAPPTTLPAAGGAPAANVTSLPPAPHPLMAAARGLPGQVMGPAKKMLGMGALGAAGALAYGMHHQNVEDREKNPLVYAPMQGSVMG